MSSTRTVWPKLQVLGIKNDKIDGKQVLLEIQMRHTWSTKEAVDAIITLADQLAINRFIDNDLLKQWVLMQIQSLDTGVASTPLTQQELEEYNRNSWRRNRQF